MSKDKFQKGIKNEKQWKEGEESELQKCNDLEVIKPFILKTLLNAEDVVKPTADGVRTCKEPQWRNKNAVKSSRTWYERTRSVI